MAYSPKMTYKGKPLVRMGNEIYYGSMSEPYVLYMQVITSKPEGDVQVADKINMMVLSTDTDKPVQERIARRKSVNGLYNALDLGSIWLGHALNAAKAEHHN